MDIIGQNGPTGEHYSEEQSQVNKDRIKKIDKTLSENPKLSREWVKRLTREIRDLENDEKRMEVIGQNGNDGEHYSELDSNKDGVVDAKERLLMISKLRDMQKDFSGEILDKLKNLEKEVHNFTIKK